MQAHRVPTPQKSTASEMGVDAHYIVSHDVVLEYCPILQCEKYRCLVHVESPFESGAVGVAVSCRVVGVGWPSTLC